MAGTIKYQRNIKLVIAYDGTGYHGFQRQSNAMTVQQIVEERLAPLFGHSLILNGSARTDTGVHAYGQVANFRTTGTIPVDRIALASRGLLPSDIVIREAQVADDHFHARINAKSKLYTYQVYCQPVASPFLRNYAWHLTTSLNVAAMRQAVQAIVGTHDFSAFRAAGGAAVNPVRTIYGAAADWKGELIEFRFWGNGFLYHMVRNLVGTLVEIGAERRPISDMAVILAGRDRTKAGMTAPPQGLYLQKVYYEDTPGCVAVKF